MLHNFMMAAREAGVSMREFREAPRPSRALHPCRRQVRYDGIVVDVDTATLAGAVGVPVDFPEDEPARCSEPARSFEEIDDLEPLDVSRDAGVQVWLEAMRLLVLTRTRVYVRGNCDQAPFVCRVPLRGIDDWMMALTDASEPGACLPAARPLRRVRHCFSSA